MTRILVTGAEGQLGRALAEIAPADSGQWLFADIAELDITDENAVAAYFEKHRPDVIVNCAAYTDVDGAENDPDAAFRINGDGPRLLAEAARATGAALIHISTDFVFDGRGGDVPSEPRPYTEDDTPSPLNVYGKSKLAGENAVMQSGCRGTIVRTSWLYSPWGRNFVKSIVNAARNSDQIRVVADQCGCPTSAQSLASAIAEIISTPVKRPVEPETKAEIYNYCDAGTVSRAGFAEEIVRIAGLPCRVVPVLSAEYASTAAVRPAFSALDTAKITHEFGIVPPSWQQALARCMKHF